MQKRIDEKEKLIVEWRERFRTEEDKVNLNVRVQSLEEKLQLKDEQINQIQQVPLLILSSLSLTERFSLSLRQGIQCLSNLHDLVVEQRETNQRTTSKSPLGQIFLIDSNESFFFPK